MVKFTCPDQQGVLRTPARRELATFGAIYVMVDPSAGLRAGTVDVGFVRPPFTDDGVVAMENVLTEPRYIVLREGHPLAERERVRPEDVVGEPWIFVEGADPVTRAFWALEDF